MRKTLLCLLLAACSTSTPPAHAGDYSKYEELQALIEQLEQDKVYAPGELTALFDQVSRQDKALSAMSKPAESVKEWKDYRPQFLTADRIAQGVEFWNRNQLALDRAARAYGVPQEIIIAIIGVETKFGNSQGRFRTLDTLSTLAFDYPARGAFFRKELLEYLKLAREEKLDPLNTYGSYAGALGYPQFMPSNWRSLAVDFDGDGHRDLIGNPTDAIGSVANYFKNSGWKTGETAALRAHIISQDYDTATSKDLTTSSTLGEIAKKGLVPRDNGTYLASTPASAIRLQGDNGAEYWLALNNFYVITRYNHSVLYAMAVWQLSQEVKALHDATLAPAPAAP
jgi:membrane-bound lytic murein transglycosylase B